MAAARKRPRGKVSMAPPAALAHWQAPGYFLAPVLAWFGPDWRPASVWGRDEVMHSAAAKRGRETQLANGYTGSISQLSKASDATTALYRAMNERARGATNGKP
jgi:hypothetical protein